MNTKAKLLAAFALVSVSLPGVAIADTSDKRIALSNNYAGNSCRQAMLASWAKVGDKAVEDGAVAAADAFTTSENQATEQAAQIQNMILQGYDAIVINAASPTALNGAVKEACDAGITVVSFDGIVTEPCAWRIAVDFKEMGRQQVEYLSTRLPDGGNLAAQAIKAAGRDIPIIVMGNRQDEMKWWAEARDADGYETLSLSIAPGVGTLAFWVAQQVLDGAEVPKDLTVPFLKVTQDTLDETLAATPEGSVANVEYSLDDAKAVIAAAN